MYRLPVFLTLISLSSPAHGQERVYILADSLDWVLSLHTTRGLPTVCQVSTRAQPGPRLSYFYGENLKGHTRFRFPLEGDPAEVYLESFTFWRDDHSPVTRPVSKYETMTNALILQMHELRRLVHGTQRLRVRAAYRQAGSYVDLDFDVRGLNALAPDLEPRCPLPR